MKKRLIIVFSEAGAQTGTASEACGRQAGKARSGCVLLPLPIYLAQTLGLSHFLLSKFRVAIFNFLSINSDFPRKYFTARGLLIQTISPILDI